MSNSFFWPRTRASFYHRSIIPRKLRRYFKGRQQLWRTLSTKDKDEATLKSLQWEARVQQVFLTLKKHGARMSPEQIEQLIAHWMESELEESEDYRATHPATDDYLEGVQAVLSTQGDDIDESLADCDYSTVAAEATALLHSAGLPALQPDSLHFKRFCRRLLQAKSDLLRMESDRWNGNYQARATLPVAALPVKPPKTVGPLFSEIVKKYTTENPRAKRTGDTVQAEFDKFLAATGGDRPIAAIARADGRTYKESLLKRGLSFATITKHLSTLSGLCRWAEKQGYCEVNPIRGLAPDNKQTKKQSLVRRPFTDAELLCIMGSQEFMAQRVKHPERYWLTLLLLFTACRREEAGQLSMADVQESDSIPFLNITDTGTNQSVKNPGSIRRIPVSSSLVDLGFLDYVQSIRKRKCANLFPQLPLARPGQRTDGVGKWFHRLVEKAGITDPAVVLHSLRHGGIHKLHVAGCPQRITETLTGHAPANVHGRYEHRELTPLLQLRDGLELLRYDAVVAVLTTIGGEP